MGLLYVLPISEDEGDRVVIQDDALVLKSYGLPMIFWGYLAGILFLVSAMAIGVKDPLLKLYFTPDPLNQFMAATCAAVLLGLPTVLFLFFFYEKRVQKKGESLILSSHLFGIPLRKKLYSLKSKDSLIIDHFMDSPNLAKMKNAPELRGFQNKGYFELFAILKDDKKQLVDRSSRKADLKKLQEILARY